jgi:two-component system response regulator RegA
MSAPADEAAPCRLLVVEDDETFRTRLAKTLAQRGFAVSCAVGVAAARDLIAAEVFHAAILDFNLPDGTGLELIGALRAVNDEVRVIILSGYATLSSAVAAAREGAIDYLVKPADIDEIEAVILGLDRKEILDAQHRRNPNEVRWEHIKATLRLTDGNLSAAARALDLHRRTLQRILRDQRGCRR